MTASHRESGSFPTPVASDEEFGRVIAFRPRTSQDLPRALTPPVEGSEAPDRGPPNASDIDDFRQRMLVNVAAFVFLAGLTGAGIWLAASISDLRRTQDCVLANRPNCAQITVPTR